MYYQVLYHSPSKKSKHNLNSLTEVQETSEQMQKRGFTRATVECFDHTGHLQSIDYRYNESFGWEKF